MKEREDDAGELLRRGSLLMHLDIETAALDRLERYIEELLRWSRKINLIAKKQSIRQIVENHFLDSLMILPYLREPGTILADIGSGAGFPGLVCKAAAPDLGLILVEPRLKRVSFLRHIIRTLALDGVEVLAQRIEDVDREQFICSHIISRAVAEIGEFVAMVATMAGDATEILCMKGPRWQEELRYAADILQQSGLVLARVEELTLPFTGASRAILAFQGTKVQ